MNYTSTMQTRTNGRSLPKGWQWVRLGDVCEVVTGNTPPKAELKYYGGNIPLIKPDNLDVSKYVDDSDEYLSTEGAKVARLLPKGSVLVSCIGKIGKTAIAARNLATNQQINSLIPSNNIDSEFLYYACWFIKPELESKASRALLPILNKTQFSLCEIPLPPLEEQQQIASRLNEQLAAVESARKAAEEQLELSNSLINAYLKESLSGSLRKLQLKEGFVEVKKGIGKTWADYPLLGTTRYGVAPAKEKVGKQPERYKLVEPGTIFYNPMRINIGSIGMLDVGDVPGITSPDYVVINAVKGVIHPRWFYYWLRSPYGEAFIKTLARGAVRERMMFTRLGPAYLDIPSYEVQTKTAEKLLGIKQLQSAIEAQLDEINCLPASLLREAFAGQG